MLWPARCAAPYLVFGSVAEQQQRLTIQESVTQCQDCLPHGSGPMRHLHMSHRPVHLSKAVAKRTCLGKCWACSGRQVFVHAHL